MSLSLQWKHIKSMARVCAFSLCNSRKYSTDSILYPYVNTATLTNILKEGHRSMDSFEIIRKLCASPDGTRLIFDDVQIPIPDNEQEILHGLLIEIGDIMIPYLFQNNHRIVNGTTVEGPYEIPGIMELERGDVVIDAGANMGLFSAVASVKGCNVYAFEPIKAVIDKYLSRTAEWNKCSRDISIINKALADKTGMAEFLYDENQVAASTMKEIRKTDKEKQAKTVTVNTITLDEFVVQMKLDRVDYIKADIEGAERNLLWGATGVIREFAPKIAIRTYHLPDDSKLLPAIIKKANPRYTIFEKYKTLYAYVER